MSEENHGESANDAGTTSSDAETKNTKVTVDRTAEEYAQRVVELSAENKKRREAEKTYKQQLQEMQNRLAEVEQKEVQEQGKWKDAYEKLKSDYEKEKKTREADKAKYVFNTVSGQFKVEATKHGCLNPDALLKIATADNLLNDLEISDEDFKVSQDSMKQVLEKAQKENPFLFGKPTPNFKDGTPGTAKTKDMKGTDLTNMELKDLIKLANSLQ